MNVSYYKELDGVRAIASLMVVFFHFFHTISADTKLLYYLSKFSILGQTGVSLFFVLSGFLITRILFSTKAAGNYFNVFYTRRLLRIFPLYYLYLIIHFFIIPVIVNTDIATWGEQFWFWFYLQGLPLTFHWSHAGPDHFWSLAVEEHFYLFWPLLIYYLKPKQLYWAIAILIFMAIISRAIFAKHGFETFSFTFSRTDELSMGAIIAILEQKKKLTKFYFKYYVLLFFVMAVLLFGIWLIKSNIASFVVQIFKYNFISFFYLLFLCIIVTSHPDLWINKILRSGFLNFIGKISYGLYVYHPLTFFLFEIYVPANNVYVRFAGSVLTSVVVAAISYYLFETRFLKMKKYFLYADEKNRNKRGIK